MVQPIEKKLTAAMDKMPKEAQGNAKEVLGHMESLDKLTGSALGLMVGMKKAEHGTAKEKQTALLKMIVGMASIEKGVKENLLAMKAQKMGAGMHGNELPSKLHMLLEKMQAKVDGELKDPARKDDPLVQIDVKMLDTMKKAVKKSEALIMVGAIAMKKAKTEEDRQKIKLSVKGAMQKVMGQLKADINDLKNKAIVVGTAELHKRQAAKPKPEDGDAPAGDEKDGDLNALLGKIAGIGAKDPNLRSH